MATKRIIVNGGTGKAGHWIVKHLLERGYDVVNVDTRLPEHPECRCLGIGRDNLGCEPVLIAADDTSSNLPSRELVRRFLPNVKDFRSEPADRSALISNVRAKQLLGWKQEFFLR